MIYRQRWRKTTFMTKREKWVGGGEESGERRGGGREKGFTVHRLPRSVRHRVQLILNPV